MAGTAALILVLSVFNGLEHLFTELSGRQEPTLLITPKTGKYLEANDSLLLVIKQKTGASAGYWIEENILIRHNQLELIGSIRGMKPEMFLAAGYDTCLINGSLPKDDGSIAVSSEIAGSLGISPGPFDQITELFAPQPGKVSVLNPEKAFKREAFLSQGVFSAGSEKSRLMVLTHLSAAEKLVGKPGMATGIVLFGHEDLMKEWSETLKILLGNDFQVKDKYQQQEAIYAVFRSEKLWSLLLLSILTGLAALNLVGSLSMLILHKKHDLFILGAMGMAVTQKRYVFGLTGMLISLCGLVGGLGLGSALIWAQQTFEIIQFQVNSSASEAYPVLFQWKDVGIVSLIVLICSIFCLWIPVRKIRD